MESPTLEELVTAYERTLPAKVQLVEFAFWGATVTDPLRARIAEHRLMEDAYVQDQVRLRADDGLAGKAKKNPRR